jgi:hypothetical protein
MTSPEGINVTAWSQASSKARTTKTPAWHDDAKKWLAGLVQQRHSGYRPSMRGGGLDGFLPRFRHSHLDENVRLRTICRFLERLLTGSLAMMARCGGGAISLDPSLRLSA